MSLATNTQHDTHYNGVRHPMIRRPIERLSDGLPALAPVAGFFTGPARASRAPAAIARLYAWANGPAAPLLGAALYGGWAVFANLGFGTALALRVGLMHGLMSAALTWLDVRLMNALYRITRRPRSGALIAVGGSLGITYAALVAVHWAIGTPRIALTLAPGLLPTVFGTVAYGALLFQRHRAH